MKIEANIKVEYEVDPKNYQFSKVVVNGKWVAANQCKIDIDRRILRIEKQTILRLMGLAIDHTLNPKIDVEIREVK